jgi:methionyl-tRNA synthetase
MLGVEGAKMSKSRGTFINARDYLEAGLDTEWLRYFYAANLGPSPSDIDLSLKELKNRVNGELLANVGNLANRALSLLWKNGGRLTRCAASLQNAPALEKEIADLYVRCDTRAVAQKVLDYSSAANARLQQKKPWDLLKSAPDEAKAELTLAVNVARLCARWLAPIVPRFARGVKEQSGAALKWGDFNPLEDAAIREPKPLVRKVEDADIQKLASKFATAPAPEARGPRPETSAITIDEFGKIDLRAGKVLSAERVPKKDKLLKLTVDLGEGAPRTIVSGVAKSYAPEELAGKNVCVVANLPPRDFGKGLVSHGMILFSDGGTREHTAVELPTDVAPGAKVK